MTAKAIQNLRMLFMRPASDGTLQVGEFLHKDFIETLYKLFEISQTDTDKGAGKLYSYDYCNLLTDKFSGNLEQVSVLLFESAFELIVNRNGIEGLSNEAGDFIAGKIEEIISSLKKLAAAILKSYSDFLTLESLKLLKSLQDYQLNDVKSRIEKCDPFLNCRTFL